MKRILFTFLFILLCIEGYAWMPNTCNFICQDDYIKSYGRLKLVGNQLSDENGQAVQLKGWSTFGLQWQVSCYTKANFEIMKGWGANVVRLAMYVQEGGY